jgi:DNA topoisomerase-1
MQAFVPKEYWSIIAKLEGHEPPQFEARLVKVKGKAAEVNEEKDATHILDVVKSSEFVVESVVTKEKRRNPVPPFTTSKLQQDAARRLGFTVKKTMMLAQRLYEGKELGEEGLIGLITYMRTDSTRISDEAMQMVRSYISDVYGGPYLPEKPVIYKSKKDAQDAHEAIRPTFVGRRPDDLKPYLTDDELKLYRLIWTRFVASQMNPAVYDQTTVDISVKDYLFRASGRVMKFDGFLAVYEESSDETTKPVEPDDEQDLTLPPLKQGEKLKLINITPRQHFTEPPPRYTEASLVKMLEEKGIGRPSTYATILSTIQDREYVTKDQGKFKPTELGTVVTDMLVKHFEDIFDVQYTARMEEELDEVEDGKMTWIQALDEFYKKFEKDLKKASKNMENLKKQEIPTDEKCEKCGSPMVIKWGQFGRFMACSGYPDCKNTKEITTDEAAKEGETSTESSEPEPCENCGKPMALKRGRFGQFLACTGYPECKTTRRIAAGTKTPKKPDVALDEVCPQCGQAKLALKEGRFGEFIACSNYPKCKYIKPKTVGVPCPKPGCGGELIERRSKRGKVFYGCLKYPDCDFVVWNKPVPEPCPQCGAPFLLEKTTKREGLVRYCNEEACDYKVPVETEKVS